MLGNDIFTEELDNNFNTINDNKPTTTITPTSTVEDDLGKTEVLDLGTME